MYSYVHLEGVGSDGVDGPPQALDGSVVAGGVGAMDTLADIAAAVFDMAACVLAPAGAAPAAAAGAAGAAALGAPAVGAQGAAPVAEGAGVTEQRIRRTVPDLPRGILTVAVLKSRSCWTTRPGTRRPMSTSSTRAQSSGPSCCARPRRVRAA